MACARGARGRSPPPPPALNPLTHAHHSPPQVPDELNFDYGEPTGLCTETSPGVFSRDWTKATVKMDCSTWTPSIVLK